MIFHEFIMFLHEFYQKNDPPEPGGSVGIFAGQRMMQAPSPAERERLTMSLLRKDDTGEE